MTVVAGRAIGAALSRVEGREKVTGEARYAFEQPIEGVAYAAAVTATIAAGEIDAIDPARALALPGVLAVISHDNAPQLGETADGELLLFQSDTVHYRGQIVAAVVAETLEAAREGADAVHIDYAPREHDVELRLGHPALLQARQGQPVLPHRHGAGRRGGRARARRGRRRRDLRHAADPQQPDGAAREPRAVGGRRPHRVRLDPGHVGRTQDARRGLRHPTRAGARRLPARRRRLRLQGHAAPAVGARRDRRQGRRAPGQGRAQPPADVRHGRLSHADDPARAPRRDPRRAPDRDRPRRLRADLDGARVRRADHHADAHDVRRARPPDDAPARGARRPHPVVDARARRVPRHVRARVRDRRAGGRVRHRPDRAADPQRARPRPGEGHPVLLAQPRRLPARGRRALRLGRPRPHPRRARGRALADRHRRGRLDLPGLPRPLHRHRPLRGRRELHGPDRRHRHRHRRAHRADADRRRRARGRPRAGACRDRRLRLRPGRDRRRLDGHRLLGHRRRARVRGAARPGRGRGDSSTPATRSRRRRSSPATRSAPSSSRSASTPTAARSASRACSGSSASAA